MQSYFESHARVRRYEEMLLVNIQTCTTMLYGKLCMMMLLYRIFLNEHKILFD